MALFFFIVACLAVANADVIATPAVLVNVPQSSQYHAQDVIGQYSYGYSNELSAKNEVRSADGQTVGSYAYVDPEGKLQNVQYRSDAIHGFQVSASNLPVAPAPIEAPVVPLPEPVQDTPEVAEARTKHLEALRAAEEDAKKPVVSAHPAVITTASRAAVEAVPVVAPSFGYSFGINPQGIFAVNAYSLQPQHIVAAYAAPGQLFAAPILAGAATPSEQSQSSPAEGSSDLPEVGVARSKPLDKIENVQNDIEKDTKEEVKN